VETAARAVGRQVVIATVASERDFDAAFRQFVNAGAGALLSPGGAVTTGQHRQIAALAIRHAFPALYTLREFVEVGGLMSYGPSQIHAYRRAGIYVGRILKGEKAGDLPVELPTKYELVTLFVGGARRNYVARGSIAAMHFGEPSRQAWPTLRPL
jgi:putative tryptophan/tyrosine transport system substrate-binding protein